MSRMIILCQTLPGVHGHWFRGIRGYIPDLFYLRAPNGFVCQEFIESLLKSNYAICLYNPLSNEFHKLATHIIINNNKKDAF